MTRLFLCCDLDRTLLPNGLQPESHLSRQIFQEVIHQCGITLTYVTGRSLALLQNAIDEFMIPVPDYAICDVGTSMYQQSHTKWQPINTWTQHLAEEWSQAVYDHLFKNLVENPRLRSQEPGKQSRFKISFYTEPDTLDQNFIALLKKRVEALGYTGNVITSIDETTATGLVDVLPKRASKYHAIHFLLDQLELPLSCAVFAGDSGNDLQVITSEIPSVLVNNAQPSVKTQAIELSTRSGFQNACYIAKGDWHELNGNYSAGILEGLVHYHPDLANTVAAIIRAIRSAN